jgi:2-polyprenyl-3-methyl-5-hydroxy-6-metoxy-1,4-benzoquinol methylase
MSIYNTLSAFNSKKQSRPQVSGDQPEYIKTKIDARFNETNKTEKSYAKNSYIFTGDISYNFHFLDDYLDIERVIPILSASAKVSTPFQILDIGTGDGAFIQAQTKSNVNVTGIAASTSLQLESIPANQFLVGNAEYLDNINGLNKKYDLIVSAQTVKHFIDPICFIHQAVDRLSNGGYLFVDDFSIPGIEKDIIAISCYLQAQGINIVIDHNMDGIKSLVFQTKRLINCSC